MNKEKIEELSLEEKIALLSGTNYMLTNQIFRLDISSVCHADGPHGLRKSLKGGKNLCSDIPSTVFPSAATTASSFNENNLYQLGLALGKEARANGVDVILGPALNIKRNPLCGRNFDYFSEDPYLSGVMATSEVLGIQVNANACIKHFAANNNENYRIVGNSVIDERTLREIYLKGFEMVIKNSNPSAIMCAYNQLNGQYCSENQFLLTNILRSEWKYDGIVMSDWGATKDRVNSLKAGLDLEMPGDQPMSRKMLYDAYKNGTLSMQTIDCSVERMLNYIDRVHKEEKEIDVDLEEHNELSTMIATDSAVLLKNKNKFLPLEKNEKILVIGEMFEKMKYQGSGSSIIAPTKLIEPIDAFNKHEVNYTYVKGYALNSKNKENDKLFVEAVEASQKYEKVLFFAGLDDQSDLEGKDRENLLLPSNQIKLINELLSMGKRVCLILFGGSIVELPFVNSVQAILMMYLPGQGGGEACYRLIYGEVNPSGHLAESWPEAYTDVPFGSEYGKSTRDLYKESVFVGYRYYSSAHIRTLFPFGYGLSYSEFNKRMTTIEDRKEEYRIKVNVENVSLISGSEVVQIYVETPKNNIFRPLRELKAFKKVFLMPGQKTEVVLVIKKNDLRYYDVKEKKFIMDGGIYKIQLCSDCLTIIQEACIHVDLPISSSPYSIFVNKVYTDFHFNNITDSLFEDLCRKPLPNIDPIFPFTMETRITEFKTKFFGRVIYQMMKKKLLKEKNKALKIKDPLKREKELQNSQYVLSVFEYNSLRALTNMSPKTLPYNVAEGIVYIANGRIFEGLFKMTKKIVAPSLPKENVNIKNK